MGNKTVAAEDENLYGILKEPNIGKVQLGLEKMFPTRYGNAAYFAAGTQSLGIRDSVDTPRRTTTSGVGATDFWLDTLYVCEFCFKYTDEEVALRRHVSCCRYRTKPPGRIQYMSPEYTIRKVRGSKHPLFCQCLCLFTKLFLDNKSMYFKTDHYDFFIIYQSSTKEPMGFFSKDLISYQKNNLACVLTLPPYQRKGIGSLLVDFSYKLSIRDGLISGPERPLSPFGLVSYLKYWSSQICWQLLEGDLSGSGRTSLDAISRATGIRIGDILLTLRSLNCLTKDYDVSLSVLRAWAKDNYSYRNSLVRDEYLVLDN
ncbi:Histone acetyltransferase [Lachancea thermotolerans]|uniref:histone acetyltransferase n=1 Tax=Lachancea thermotolerans (strain ATCC 56472 / CBS 6340 / NRRL Y-8284) TaxID=559295 RepID=C5DI27_LACTC|nr:KLTH0E09196p [Lachancea thermotolerans CBS 6340]CAR23438.1 KLTH0E09196p [Lachancea thermotolerans CBS 6340]